MDILLPKGWPRPKGYSNGIAAKGRLVFVSGQVGWNEREEFEADDIVGQVRRALENTLAVLREGGAKPEHTVRMTWFITDKREYVAKAKEIGAVYRALFGTHYPAMALVEVKSLLADRAKVEIETTAVVPEA
ncbi:MAG TPA: RidA family protein [Sphingomonadales bacterium]|nr:RidA family protein [Sphingomonadales bacterium]